MLKRTLLLPLFLLPLGAAPLPERAAAYVRAATGVQQEMLVTLQELTALLEGVQSKETAEAAVPSVREAVARLQQLQADAAGFAPPSAAEESAFQAAIAPTLARFTAETLMQELMRLSAEHTYGSEALTEELSRLFRKDS